MRTSHGDAESGTATLDLEWLPSPRVSFHLDAGPHRWWNRPDPSYELALNDLVGQPASPASVTLTRMRIGTVTEMRGRVHSVQMGAGPADRIAFMLPNWPGFMGSRIDVPE